ncbi:MAG: type II secretion system F family protein [Candidatus Omnitrophica bacterium]|nr:type II secretion system F family protein [Candidatus Omnitrophota bacterium]MCM8793520.1 type II secretion system F family protein [Candidatus Omnitrophota bacterium]
MGSFFYRVKTKTGEIREGVLETESEAQAIETLSSQGYFILSLSEKKSLSPVAVKEPSVVTPSVTDSFHKVGIRDLSVFTRQLSDLINAGVTLLHALDILRNQLKTNPNFSSIINVWYEDIQAGLSFSQSMGKFKDYLPSVLPALVASGEASGNLDRTMRQAAELFEKEYELRMKVKSAMIYPSLVATVGGITVFILLSFVIPKISSIFVEMGEALPLLTSILIRISNLFAQYWWMVILGFVGLIFFYKTLLKDPEYKLMFDQWKLRLPLIRKITLETELARFSRILGMLLHSGVPIIEAIEVTLPVLDTEVYRKELGEMKEKIKAGRALTASMEKEDLFPQFATDMVKVGEESGKLDESLVKVAESYEKSLEYTLKILTDLLEPILILIVGIMIGFIVIGMLLPIFQLNLIIK